MEYKYEYITSEEKEKILNEHIDLVLSEEQNITEGNFLIFIDQDSANKMIQQKEREDRINTIIEYINLNNNSISNIENSILEIEKNKTLEGVV